MWLATGMIVGGALGNLIDRVRDGRGHRLRQAAALAAFNLADSAITLGVVALFLLVGA